MLVARACASGSGSRAPPETTARMLALWDLVKGILPPAPRAKPAPKPRSRPHRRRARGKGGAAGAMEGRYEEITRQMLARYGVRVRRWRTHMSGIAWEVYYH